MRNTPPKLFLSLRWRFVFPVAIVVMVVAMIGSYIVANSLTANTAVVEDNIALQSATAALDRVDDFYVTLRNEAVRVGYTSGVQTAIETGDATMLVPILIDMATLANLDTVRIVNTAGIEVVRVTRLDDLYIHATNTDLSSVPIMPLLLSGEQSVSSLTRTDTGFNFVTGIPIVNGDVVTGAVLIERSLDAFVEDLQAGSVADVTLYGTQGELAATTLPVVNDTLDNLQVNSAILQQTLSENTAVTSSLSLQGTLYRAVYMPWVVGDYQIGVMGIVVPNNVPFATQTGRQLVAGLAAALAAGAVIMVYLLAQRAIMRLERVRGTANAIAQGHTHVRTHMIANDEIGAVGKAVDYMADAFQQREDQMRVLLTRERRERFYVYSVLESMSDGVIVQDVSGAVLVMNETARRLLGTLANFNPFAPTTEAARQVLGDALAPGLYSLGDPQQLAHKGIMLSAQAAAVLSPTRERLGTVTILRDVTEQVRKDQRRDAMFQQLQNEVEPIHDTLAMQRSKEVLPAADFAREIARHAAALQKMIVDMRELTHYASHDARALQRMLSVETLLWSVANDWRQIAMAANLTLQVTVNRKGLLILGDEGRLRLAIGNLVDNAIKFTPSGGMITLEIEKETDSAVHLRIRDNGVGVSNHDLPNVFVPFYRGTPLDTYGQVIRVPGMGQGLAIAKQILEAHGGKIKVKSRAGAGTAVYLSLPLTAGVGGNIMSGEAMFMEGDTVVISLPRAKSTQ